MTTWKTTESTEEPSPESVDDSPAVASAHPYPAVIIGLSTLLVAAMAAAGFLGWKVQRDNEIDHAATQALAVGQQYAVTLTSIDAAHIDRDFAAIDAGATGAFKQMYAQSAIQLQPLLVQAQSVSKGRVLSASVRSASRERVVLMMFVDAEVTNSTTTGPRVDRSRILMTLDDVEGRWLASSVEIL